MKAIKLIIGLSLLAVLFTAPLLMAQDTNSAPSAPDVSNDPLPTSKEDFWRWGIAAFSLFATAAGKWLSEKVFPRVPGWLILVSVPLVGMALGAAVKALTGANLGWVDGTQAGALAVFMNQFWRHTVGKFVSPESSR